MVAKRQKDSEGDLFPRGAGPNSTPRVKKRDGQTLFGPQLKRPRQTRPSEDTAPLDAPVIQYGAALSHSRLSVGMTALALVTKANQSTVDLLLPGGLRAYVDPNEILVQPDGQIDNPISGIVSNHHDLSEDSATDSSDSEPEDDDAILPVWQLVSVGNVVRTAVVDINVNKHGRKVVLVSLKPELINVGMHPARVLTKHYPVFGAVKSVEDHGYVISFGSNIPHTGFLLFDKCPQSGEEPEHIRLKSGAPVEVVTRKKAKLPKVRAKNYSGVVNVTAMPSKVLNTVLEPLENINYQDLRAGLLVKARILKEGVGGVALSAFGVFSVAVDAAHVPRAQDGSWNIKIGKEVFARFLYVDPAQKRIGASLLDSYVQELKPREIPRKWKIGTLIKPLVVESVKPGYGLILRHGGVSLRGGDEESEDGNHEMKDEDITAAADSSSVDIPIFAHISRVSDSKGVVLESKFQKGMVISGGARIVSLSRFDGLVNVDFRPSVLSRKALSIEEVEVGALYDCKIISHTAQGSLRVAVDGDPHLHGVVPLLFVTDILLSSERLSKIEAFRVGSTIKCRVVVVDLNRAKIILTSRKSLTFPKFPVLCSFEEAARACREMRSSSDMGEDQEHGSSRVLFTGITRSVTRNGGLVVDFFNNVSGVVKPDRVCIDEDKIGLQSAVKSVYPVGETVHVRVVKAFEKKRCLFLSMKLNLEKEKEPPFELGSLVRGSVKGVDKDSKHFLVSAKLRKPKLPKMRDSAATSNETLDTKRAVQIDCYLPFGHLSDTPGMANRLANEMQKHLTEHHENSKAEYVVLRNAMVLRYRGDIPVLTLKESLRNAFECKNLLSSFDDVEKKMKENGRETENHVALRGYIKALLPGGVIVGFLGDVVGFARKSRIANHFVRDPTRALTVDQSVAAIIDSIDVSKRRFDLSLRPSDIGQRPLQVDTLSLFRSMPEWKRVLKRQNSEEDFPIGVLVDAVAGDVRTYGRMYELHSSTSSASAVGVVLDVSEIGPDIIVDDIAVSSKQVQPSSRDVGTEKFSSEGKAAQKKLVRILDVDPFSGLIDLSRDEEIILGASKKLSVSPGKTCEATVLLVKSSYLILALKKSNTKTVIGFALGPVLFDSLIVSPGMSVTVTILDNSQSGTKRNLVVIDWESFRGNSKASLEKCQPMGADYSSTLALLRNGGPHDISGVLGMKISVSVTRKYTLFAHVNIGKGIVGRVHLSNTAFIKKSELEKFPLGILSESDLPQFKLPEPGTVINPAYVAGFRSGRKGDDSSSRHVEVSFSEERCGQCSPSVGDRVLGFVTRASSRFSTPEGQIDKKKTFNRTFLAISPTTVLSCADVDCLFDDDSIKMPLGSPVVCLVTKIFEEGSERIRASISENGKGDKFFLGIVQNVIPGEGLRVSIPWCARESKAQSTPWGTVCLSDMGNDFDEVLNKMESIQSGDIVRVSKIATVQSKGTGKFAVLLTMRNLDEEKECKDRLITELNAPGLSNGDNIRGFVQAIGKKGCFVQIGRNVVAHVKLCDLADWFVTNPEEKFPPGKLVQGVISDCRPGKISLFLGKKRRQLLIPIHNPNLKEGMKVIGVVERIECYGAFLDIGIGPNALLHRREVDEDRIIGDPFKEWVINQQLSVIVTKINGTKINVGTKRCYFEAAGIEGEAMEELLAMNDRSKSEVSNTTEGKELRDDVDMVAVNRAEEEDDIKVELSSGDELGKSNCSDDLDVKMGGDGIEIGSCNMDVSVEDTLLGQEIASAPPLNVSKKFEFLEATDAVNMESEQEEETEELITEESKPIVNRTSRDKREKKRLREAAEKEIREREEALANDPDAPETSEDYERMLMGDPNSSVLWIRYMAHCLQLSQVDKARSIAERALQTINVQSETEHTNLWCAYINMEAQYGSMNSTEQETNDSLGVKRDAAVFRVFDRACERITDVENFHLQVSSALKKSFPKLCDEILQRAIRKFKGSKEVWIANGQTLFSRGDKAGGRRILERALVSLEKKKHVAVISKFAQLEYKFGSIEWGRTVFESLTGNYPKRVDLWHIYLNMEVSQCNKASEDTKKEKVEQTRLFCSIWEVFQSRSKLKENEICLQEMAEL